MKNSTIRILSVFLVLQLLMVFSCFPGNDCGPFDDIFYKVSQIQAINIDKTNSTDIHLQQWPDSSNVLLDHFAIAIVVEPDYFTSIKPRFHNPFLHEALACSPPSPEPVESISGIEIVSNADFITHNGDTIPAGFPLNALFKTAKTLREGFPPQPLSAYLQSNEAVPTDGTASDFLFLTQASAINQFHRFTVTYSLDNGNTFSATTNSIGIY
ncbi:MAG TPA: hypothetical protein ENJ20_00980 [Bacteroidetes bacterium]|nr:hypothetical protein [Bacteroidota bacterium]